METALREAGQVPAAETQRPDWRRRPSREHPLPVVASAVCPAERRRLSRHQSLAREHDMDQTLTLVLRFVHIVGGVFWVGAVFLMVGFIFPTVRATGPQGGRFMQELMQRRRLSVYMNAAAGLTMLSGFILYGRLIAATDGAWAGTRTGMALGIGGLATVIAAIIGGSIIGRGGQRLGKLGEAIQASGGPPSPEQAAEMSRLQARMGGAMRVVAGLLLVAVTSMAIARYL